MYHIMHYDGQEKAFILDGDDRLAIGAPAELSYWPIQDIGHLFEELAFAPDRIAALQEWYPEASAEWIATE